MCTVLIEGNCMEDILHLKCGIVHISSCESGEEVSVLNGLGLSQTGLTVPFGLNRPNLAFKLCGNYVIWTVAAVTFILEITFRTLPSSIRHSDHLLTHFTFTYGAYMEGAGKWKHGDIPALWTWRYCRGLLEMPWTKFGISPWSIGCPTRCCKPLAKRMANKQDTRTKN